ncbi:hypothetical protein WG901_19890 [Novosphingobium sp. PS1R-30]|uniref:Uncharacterized protein n=1 Tax=Novosphingobium anseongense TaxID=3133436 RepID=A0ABU8S0R9_9SPHN|nr:MAG: hypothetical protein EOO76_21785 [Novosphingobium sp.]
MTTWFILLGGLIVWTAHFFGLYALAEIAPAPWRVVVLTLACLVADLWLLHYVRHLPRDDAFSVWRRSVATGGALLSLLAVTWQALPALT